MKNQKLQIIVETIKQGLEDQYQDLLESIVLYGSQARGDARQDSDIDLLVVLKSLVHPCEEIDKTTDLIAEICLDYDVVISWQFMSLAAFETQDSSFHRNIKKDGLYI